MAGRYEIRDPIHGSIVIDELERRVVDHPWFQRLRHIRQLGFVSLVYPGAVHDRFQHSLGVMHLAGSMWQQLLAQSPEFDASLTAAHRDHALLLLRLAGLLHDTGHAPFSHTAEAFLPPRSQLDLPWSWYREGCAPAADSQASHEDLTLALVQGLQREGVLAAEIAQDVAAIICPDIRPGGMLQDLAAVRGILTSLISGELDADRCDYLLRDSHYTGVSYGVYDLPRLLHCLRVIDGPDGPELGLDLHGVHPLESLLLARYHMFLQVYFHKTPPAFEYYLSQAVAHDEIVFSIDSLASLVEQRDDTVLGVLYAAEKAGHPWSSRIVRREPAHLVWRERIGADGDEFSQRLLQALREHGCQVFTRRSRQVFTKLDGAGDRPGRRLLCERRVLGRRLVDPVTRHSDLLAQFNAPIDLLHTYVLREDEERARGVLDRLLPGMAP
ncbi:MAG: HD domain-containing protein [Planctomycetota bacterium]